MEVETPYELLKDDKKKQLGKNNEAKMTLYNSLPRKEYFSISTKETIDSGFTRFNVIFISLKSLDQDYSSKNHELTSNLKVYEIILENNGIYSKTTKEKVKSLALKAKVTREQTSDDSDKQEGSDEDVDEEEAKAFNLMARNFRKFFQKGNRFRRGNRFDNGANRFERGHGNRFGNKGSESSRQRQGCYNYGEEGHFIGECPNPKENKAFVGRAWSDSEDDDEPQNDATCLMAADSQEVQIEPSTSNNNIDLFELQNGNEELLRLVPSCFAIFYLEPLSSSFDFVFVSEIFKSLSFRLDRLCHLAILCLDQHAHTLHHLESLLTI
ncbi:retrovirus-related pol polyprotein from transposon TNT 1-94 [Tanacetum coccineum]|uniref:Retrovirus-related pol polyprotein from transposon TNT 1-94 n=1 Tax=Tanacetum coccineum TaxID=301880 RepID=A0ABQ4XVI6_9ASTR